MVMIKAFPAAPESQSGGWCPGFPYQLSFALRDGINRDLGPLEGKAPVARIATNSFLRVCQPTCKYNAREFKGRLFGRGSFIP